MKISIGKVEVLRKSLIVEMYKKVIDEANKSGDSRRIIAAKQVLISRTKLMNFLEAAKKWKTKNGKYLVPRSDFSIVDGVSVFIKHESVFTKIIQSCGRNKSR